MNPAALLLAFVAQVPQPAAPPAPAFRGSFADGLAELRTLALAKEEQQALALATELEPLARGDAQRAALAYARGVTHQRLAERQPAGAEFQHARADGRDELRLSSIYNLGALALDEAEGWYKQLPEVSGQTPQPGAGAPPAAPVPPVPPVPNSATPGGAPKPPDALAEARKAYLAAREHLVERLRAQWDDADTRADVELVQKRLKRLDEIEKQRKEQQQKQKDPQQKPQDDKQDPKQDPKDPQQKQDPKDKQDGQDQKPEDKPQDQPQDQPPSEKPQDKDKPQPDPQQKPEEQKPPEPQTKPADAQEKQLTQEEMTRLLDKLQELEQQAEKLRAKIHKARRQSVKKDW